MHMYSSNIVPHDIQPLVYHQLNCWWKENLAQDLVEYIHTYNCTYIKNKW